MQKNFESWDLVLKKEKHATTDPTAHPPSDALTAVMSRKKNNICKTKLPPTIEETVGWKIFTPYKATIPKIILSQARGHKQADCQIEACMVWSQQKLVISVGIGRNS